MIPSSVGYSPSGLLSGLRTKQPGDVGAFAKGQAMQGAAALGLESAKQNQQMGMKAEQQESQMRQAQSQLAAGKAQNSTQEQMAAGALANRQRNFNLGNAFDYAGLQKRKQLQWQQALLNNVAQDV